MTVNGGGRRPYRGDQRAGQRHRHPGPEALPYLFERFYRVDQSRARASGGSGIGLTISRHLVWAMGGELTAVSEGLRVQGSCFTFALPLVAETVKRLTRDNRRSGGVSSLTCERMLLRRI